MEFVGGKKPYISLRRRLRLRRAVVNYARRANPSRFDRRVRAVQQRRRFLQRRAFNFRVRRRGIGARQVMYRQSRGKFKGYSPWYR